MEHNSGCRNCDYAEMTTLLSAFVSLYKGKRNYTDILVALKSITFCFYLELGHFSLLKSLKTIYWEDILRYISLTVKRKSIWKWVCNKVAINIILYQHSFTLRSQTFKHLVVSLHLVFSMFNTVNKFYYDTGIKFVLPKSRSGTERIRLSTVCTAALHLTCIHATHTNTHTVNREHSPSTAAQTNTLKIQTTHIQTLSLLNELALLRKDSATTLYHTLIPWGERDRKRRTEEKKHSGIWKRKRKREGERRNQKAPGEREESRKRKVCTSLLISLRMMIEGIGHGGWGWLVLLVEEGWFMLSLLANKRVSK